MSAGTLYDTCAPSFEVRIYRDDRLLVRAFCESPEEATAVASQGSGLDHVYVLVDDGVPDVTAPVMSSGPRRPAGATTRTSPWPPGRCRDTEPSSRASDGHRSHGGDGPRTGGAGQGRPRR